MPKQRAYNPPSDCVTEDLPTDPGQLYTSRTRDFYRDLRAYQVCDIVRIHVVERSTAMNNAQTEVQNDGSLNFGADVLGQLKVSGIKGIDTERLLDFTNKISSDRYGATRRTGDVEFSISATVKKVFNNGNLFLEGETAVLVNSEENHFYVSGLARPEDVRANNSILSSRLADAHIEFTGRGIIAEGQEPGWLARIWNWILSPL
ncbi:MAG: flagellar basal body L-ring protein FlgH [Myxococcales bacterium]|nr:flagellar basal body L-ring protein FlgH [Myxococcales bacterium]